jgi:formate-nitrite transporter family protein
VPGLYLRLLLSSALAVGFIIAIMGRTDVFTEYTTIAIFPVLIGTAPLGSLLRLWAYVYASNVVGAAAFGMLAARLALELQLFDRAAAAMLVEGLAGHPYWVLGISAFVAGWLMGLLSWLITAGRDTISQVFFIGIVTGLIGFAHLHHCVSWTAEGALALSLGAVTLQEVARVLVWATLGNAAGGVVFAVMVRYGALLGDDDKRGRDRDRREDSAQLRHGSGSTDERSE